MPTRHAYFPIDGFISLVAIVAGSPGIEVGMVGREGMLGSQLALGAIASPLHAVVQGSGSALRTGRVAFGASSRAARPCSARSRATSRC